MILEIAPPAGLDGVTFVFEKGRCGQWCRGWWPLAHGLVYGFMRGSDGIEQRIKVCPVHAADFTVAGFLESDELHRYLEYRKEGRIKTEATRKRWQLESAATQLLDACHEALTDSPDKTIIQAAIAGSRA